MLDRDQVIDRLKEIAPNVTYLSASDKYHGFYVSDKPHGASRHAVHLIVPGNDDANVISEEDLCEKIAEGKVRYQATFAS